ncbi:ABC transporter transmembrane domain-containing protein [Salinispirillum marinum]|uniref:ABC transporter transmembrane domain-containing protein n=2 Tax=Saccharospirillaceae TaxID=255527 RepID=A0ABV8BET0_9GAMM
MDAARTPRTGLTSLVALWPFIQPYRRIVAFALCALLTTSGLTLALGQGVRILIDEGFISGSLTQLNHTLLVLLGVIAVMALATFARFYWVSWLGERVTADIRQAVFDRIITLHPSYFEENRSGEIMSRLTTDTTLLQSIIGSSLSFALRSLVMLVGGLVMLLITNLKLSLVVFGAVPLVLLPILLLGRRVRRLSRDSQDRIADVGSYAGEIIQQIKTVQSYVRQGFEQLAFQHEVERAFGVARQRIRQRSLLLATVIFLAFTAIGVMVWMGGRDVINGTLSGGELAAFVFYAIIVASGVATVSEIMGELQRAAGATERLLELLSAESSIFSPAEPQSLDTSAPAFVRFNAVTFHYPSRPNHTALNAFNLVVKRGETVALVGPSGAGKSTLFELLLRFYDPQAGSVEMLGVDARQADVHQLRSRIAWVPQQPTLFSNDVWYNIRYGRPDATDDEVIAAAKAAFADDFIQQLPDGYSSYLGENGVRLSGGQKQRLVIARAILHDPELLLLDEATSALDAESEFQVQKALDNLTRERTTLVIAHRLATVRNADRIIVLQDGQAIAEGTHDQLLQDSALYQRLAALQFNDVAA